MYLFPNACIFFELDKVIFIYHGNGIIYRQEIGLHYGLAEVRYDKISRSY